MTLESIPGSILVLYHVIRRISSIRRAGAAGRRQRGYIASLRAHEIVAGPQALSRQLPDVPARRTGSSTIDPPGFGCRLFAGRTRENFEGAGQRRRTLPAGGEIARGKADPSERANYGVDGAAGTS